MKTILRLVVTAILAATLAHAQAPVLREASAAQVTAGTAHDVYVSPARLGGLGSTYLPLSGGTVTGVVTFNAQPVFAVGGGFTGLLNGGGAHLTGVDNNSGTARFIGYGADGSTNSGIQFISARADGTNAITPFAVSTAGAVTVTHATGVSGVSVDSASGDGYFYWKRAGTTTAYAQAAAATFYLWGQSGKALSLGADNNEALAFSTTLNATFTGNVVINGPNGKVLQNNRFNTYDNGATWLDITNTTGYATMAVNSAASSPTLKFTGTWFTGGSATTTKPHFLIEPSGTTSTNWSTSGTGLGVNAASGFGGRLIDAQIAGVHKFYLDNGGNVVFSGNLAFQGSISNNNSGVLKIASSGIAFSDYNGQTGTTYSLQAADTAVTFNNASGCTVTLGTATSGRTVIFRTIAAGAIISAGSNVVPVAGGAAGTAILAATAGKWATLQSDGTNWQIIQSN